MSAPSFTNLTLEKKKFNNVDVGNCHAPAILTTLNCEVSDGENVYTAKDQIITGDHTFGSSDLAITKVNLEDGATVNDLGWSTVVNEMISRNDPGTVTISKKKTFQQKELLFDDDVVVVFESDVFGLSPKSPHKVTDMSFTYLDNKEVDGVMEPVMPDLVQALQQIKTNSDNFPDQFLHHTPVYTVPSLQNRAKTISVLRGLDLDTLDKFNDLPFHLVTLVGNTKGTKQTKLLFRRLTDVDGEVVITSVDELTKVISTQYFSMDDDSMVFGEMIPLMDKDGVYYALLYKDASDQNKFKLFRFSKDSDGAWSIAEKSKGEARDFVDIEPVKRGGKTCFVGCGNQDNSINCQDPTKTSIDQENFFRVVQSLNHNDFGNCFKVSTVDVEPSETLLAFHADQDSSRGKIHIYSSKNDDDFKLLATLRCFYCTHSSIGMFDDQVFLVLTSNRYSFTLITKYDADLQKFQVFQSLDLDKPSETIFFNYEGRLYLSIVAGREGSTEIRRFVYQGAMGFVEIPKFTIGLAHITSHEIITHPLFKTIFLSTTGRY